MAPKLSENMGKLIHRMGQEREDRIISGKTNLTVAAIFLIDDNWKVFKEYRNITGRPLRPEEIEEVEKMLRCKDPRYGLLSRRLRKWVERVIDVWRRHEECLLGKQLELFQNLLESKKETDEKRNRDRLQILCPRRFSEMELLFIAYLKDNELCIMSG